MLAKGHTALASAITLVLFETLPYFKNMGLENSAYFYASTIVGSLFPDIDESRSYIGRRLGIVSVIVSSMMKHRTFTHYLIFPIIIYFVGVNFIQSENALYALQGFTLGILLHTLGDMFTIGGIRGYLFPLFPNTQIWMLPKMLRFYTGSTQEYFLIFGLYMINLLIGTDILFFHWMVK